VPQPQRPLSRVSPRRYARTEAASVALADGAASVGRSLALVASGELTASGMLRVAEASVGALSAPSDVGSEAASVADVFNSQLTAEILGQKLAPSVGVIQEIGAALLRVGERPA
jgi:hypothetical protein